MQIDFVHAGEKTECKVGIKVPNCGLVTWTFQNQHSDKFYSGFVVAAMQTQMRDALEAMRRNAYEQGWKDAKSRKTPKQTWFRRFWTETV